MAQSKTPDQVEAMQRKAVRFLRDVVGDQDKADEIEALSPEAYAERKGVQIVADGNPNNRRHMIMVKSRAALEAEVRDLKDYVEELEDKLDTIAEVVGGDEEDEDEDDADDDDDDDTVPAR